MSDIKQKNYEKAEKDYQRAVELSKELIGEFNKIIDQARTLDQNKIAVFEA